MILGFQIIAILFALSMIYFALHAYKRKELGKGEIISWEVLWGGAIIIIIFPDLLRKFSMTFLITRVFDLMVIGGFILVISMVANSYVRTRRLEKKMEELVRKLAIKGESKKKKEGRIRK